MFFKGILLSGIGNRRRAPLAVADVVLDVLLRDLRVRRPWSPNRVRVNVRRANAAGLRPSTVRQEDANQSQRDGEMDSHFHLAASVESDTRIHSEDCEVQYAFG